MSMIIFMVFIESCSLSQSSTVQPGFDSHFHPFPSLLPQKRKRRKKNKPHIPPSYAWLKTACLTWIHSYIVNIFMYIETSLSYQNHLIQNFHDDWEDDQLHTPIFSIISLSGKQAEDSLLASTCSRSLANLVPYTCIYTFLDLILKFSTFSPSLTTLQVPFTDMWVF